MILDGNNEFWGSFKFDCPHLEASAFRNDINEDEEQEEISLEGQMPDKDQRPGGEKADRKEFFVLPILRDKGLILEAIEGRQGQYRRAGEFSVSYWDQKLAEFLEASTPVANDCIEVSVDENGETIYMIEII
ncbi:hypothetical protein ONS96_007773 [Cadophora gregata f. sp. sojae]|nr:hypothetical protein ONS96_007773 [Cadophora gregata f. sp. sojae]